MNRVAYGNLFKLFGGFNLIFALSMWIITQGGFAELSLPGLDPKAKIASSYLAIIVIGILLSLTGIVGAWHIRLARAAKAPPMPAVGLGDGGEYTPCTWVGTTYEIALILLFIALPAGSLYHLNKQVASEGIIWNEELPAGAHLTAACLLPSFWPFGECPESTMAGGRVVIDRALSLRDIVDGGEPKLTENGDMSRLWLTNLWCDVYWAREMAGPQVAARKEKANCVGPGRSASEARSYETLKLLDGDAKTVEDFSVTRNGLPTDACSTDYAANTCTGVTNRSRACSENGDGCRGVQWIRVLSPTLVIVPSLLGWIAAANMIVVLGIQFVGCRKGKAAGA